MSVSDKEEGIDIERSACIRRVFKEVRSVVNKYVHTCCTHFIDTKLM